MPNDCEMWTPPSVTDGKNEEGEPVEEFETCGVCPRCIIVGKRSVKQAEPVSEINPHICGL